MLGGMGLWDCYLSIFGCASVDNFVLAMSNRIYTLFILKIQFLA